MELKSDIVTKGEERKRERRQDKGEEKASEGERMWKMLNVRNSLAPSFSHRNTT